MPRKSNLNYKQVKDIAYKIIQNKKKTPVLFRQLQYQSILIFLPGNIEPIPIKNAIDAKNTYWHFIVVSDDYVFNLVKNDKELWNKVRP